MSVSEQDVFVFFLKTGVKVSLITNPTNNVMMLGLDSLESTLKEPRKFRVDYLNVYVCL